MRRTCGYPPETHLLPFDNSSLPSTLHGIDWETGTTGDIGESLNSEKNAIISVIKSFQRKRKTTKVSEGESSRSWPGFKSELKEI